MNKKVSGLAFLAAQQGGEKNPNLWDFAQARRDWRAFPDQVIPAFTRGIIIGAAGGMMWMTLVVFVVNWVAKSLGA